MREVYRKRGRVARHEDGHLVLVAETGEAVDENGTFITAPLRDAAPAEMLSAGDVQLAAESFRASVEPPVRIERLIVTHGIAEHEFDGVVWTEETRRAHVALVHGGIRALIDRADFDAAHVHEVSVAMARWVGEREAPGRLRMSAAVSAALLPSLVGIAPPNVEMWQIAGGRDGKGMAVETAPLIAPPWPNWYRPSYRVRPRRAAFNVSARFEVTGIDPDLPVAVALLAPVDGTIVRALIAEGSTSYSATIRVVRIDGIAEAREWFPYGAGAWGAEMML